MTQPADTVTKFFKVIDGTSPTNDLVPSLTVADFTFLGFKHEPGGVPTVYSLGSAITEPSPGYYSWTYAKAAVACHDGQDILPVNPDHLIVILPFSGETESQDLASLGNMVAQPVGGAGVAFSFGARVQLELVVYRQREVTQAFTDVDLSGAAYGNWKIGIRDKDQTEIIWDCDSGKLDGFLITGDDAGLLTITWPESLIGPVYTTWAATRAYALGDFVRPVTNNGFVYESTVAGTTAGAEPVWPTTEGGTITNGGVTWTCLKRSIWFASVARLVGDMVRPIAGGPNVFRCTVAGTSHSAEPAWPTAAGTTVTETGGVTWQCMSDPYAALGEGEDTVDLKYEVTADKLSTAKTRAIIPSSTLQMQRRENGA